MFPVQHYFLFLFILCKSLPSIDSCPSDRYCTCSNDLTIISCTNRQLTDRLFEEIRAEIPRSTVLLNLSSNALTSLQSLPSLTELRTLDLSFNQLQSLPSNLFVKYPQLSSLYVQSNSLRTIPKTFNEISNIHLDLSSNPLHCQCSMKWLIKWFETVHLLRPISCQRSSRLTEEDFCSNRRDFLEISPDQSQIVYENDSITLNCSSNAKVFWTLNNEFYSSNSMLHLSPLQFNHSGRWTCHHPNRNRSIDLHVFKVRSQHFCPSLHMETSKGQFTWPRTLTGQTIQFECPFGAAAWTESLIQQPVAFYTCSNNRQWIDLDLSQCAFRTNISREFDRFLADNQTNLLPKLVTFISKISLDEVQFDDVIFLIDLIDEEQEKSRLYQGQIDEIATFIYRLTDLILQIPRDFSSFVQYQSALKRLRLIIDQLFHRTNRSWFYVGKQLTAMTFESPASPGACFVPNRPLLTLICGILNRERKRHESRLATMEFVGSINQSSIYRMVIDRQGKLFQFDAKRPNHPVISLQLISSKNISNVKFTFYSQSNQAKVISWNSNQSLWEQNPSFCRIHQQNLDRIETDCSIKGNRSIILSYSTEFHDPRSLFLNENYLELAVLVSSIIASICFCLSIGFYLCYHKIYLMPRSFFHCLINYWLSLAILFPLFAFGIRRSDSLIFCQIIAVTLHYLCLTTVIWLTLLSYSIWQKLYMIWSGKNHSEDEEGEVPGKSVMIVDYDDDGLPIMKIKAKPVLQFYFLAYGISFIICGINVAISRDQYISNKICFLNNFESFLTVVIPMGIFILLSFIFLLAARINITRLTKEAIRLRNLPDENEVEMDFNVPNDENVVSSKPNETVPIIHPLTGEDTRPVPECHQSHLESLASSDMDHQHQPSNQLLAILFQNLLLILIFITSLSIYSHPLRSYSLRFEHSIYNHLYGFFVLLLAFFVLAFYVLSRSDLTLHCKYHCSWSNRKKKRLLDQSYSEPPPPPQTPQHSPTINDRTDAKVIFNQNLSADESFNEPIAAPSPPHSHYSSSVYNCQTAGENPDRTAPFGSKYQASIASKYYARNRHLLKNNGSTSDVNSQKNDGLPLSTLKPIEQEFIERDDTETKKSSEQNEKPIVQSVPIDTSRISSVRPPTHFPLSPRPQYSPSQAIIRPLPIVRLSSPDLLASNPGRNSFRIMPSPTTEERQATYVYLNKNAHLVQQEASSKDSDKIHPHAHVAYIDEDEEGSVSLKSSTCHSRTSSSSSPTPSLRKDRSQTLSSSSSSSSSTFSNRLQGETSDSNQIVLHESSV